VIDGKGNDGITSDNFVNRTLCNILGVKPSLEAANECTRRHKNAANVLFLDMHVAPLDTWKLANEMDHSGRIFFDLGQKNK